MGLDKINTVAKVSSRSSIKRNHYFESYRNNVLEIPLAHSRTPNFIARHVLQKAHCNSERIISTRRRFIFVTIPHRLPLGLEYGTYGCQSGQVAPRSICFLYKVGAVTHIQSSQIFLDAPCRKIDMKCDYISSDSMH